MRPPERTRIRVSPGAPALLAVFVWLSSPEVLGAVLLAALCHELGHYATLRRRGGSIRAQHRQSGSGTVFIVELPLARREEADE